MSVSLSVMLKVTGSPLLVVVLSSVAVGGVLISSILTTTVPSPGNGPPIPCPI